MKRACTHCGRRVSQHATRCRDCYRDWIAGPPPAIRGTDWVVVERLMRGEATAATDDERAEAARRLLDQGRHPILEIARRTGIAERTIHRWKTRAAA